MKKLLALLLTLAMVLSVGCGAKTTSESAKAPDAPAASTAPADKPAEAAANVGTPEKPIVLTMVAKDMPKNDEDIINYFKAVEAKMAEKEGKYIKIDLVEIQEGTYSDSVSLLLQSGTIPDIIYFQGGDYQFGITQGILEDLTPYLEKSKYVKNILEPHSVECLKNYPYLLWAAPTRDKVPVVRQDWFEKMTTGAELEANPTPDNYYKFFKELQDKFTHKSAFTVQGATDGLLEVDMLFNQAFGEGKSWVKDASGAYTYSKISPSELEKLQFYAKLYKEGLLDNEYLTKKYEAKEKAMYGGTVGVVMATQGAVASKYNVKMTKQNGEASKLHVLPPAKGEKNWSFAPTDVSKESRGWAISKTSANKQMAFDFLDFMAGPDGQLIDTLGIEGKHYEIKDGKIFLTAEFPNWYKRVHETRAKFDPTPAIDPSTPFMPEIAKESAAMVAAHTSNDNAFLIPDELISNWDAAKSVYNEFAADIISGKKTAADWDAFVKEWNDMGGKDVVAYANTILK